MEDLSKIAPKLSKTGKENPFGVPPQYFDDFNARLQLKLQKEKPDKKQGSPIIRYLKPVLGLAASFAIIFMLVYWPLSKFNFNQTQVTQGNTYQENSLENEYISILEYVDDNSFLAFLEDDAVEDPFSDEQLINYLSQNLSDYDIYFESE